MTISENLGEHELPEPLRKAVVAFSNGLRWLVDPPAAEVDLTPKTLLFEAGKLRVYRYHAERPCSGRPVLLIPPLMVRPYIFDLRPEQSFAGFLLERGLDVYLVDFGVPDAADEDVTLMHYVTHFMSQAVEGVRAYSGQPRVSLVGYCMGGLFGLLYAASAGQEKVQDLVLLACPIDFKKMGMISVAAQVAHKTMLSFLDTVGNVPAAVPALLMRATSPLTGLTQRIDFVLNLWNEEYLKGHESLSTWFNDFIPGPQAAFRDYIENFLIGNELVDGHVMLNGQEVDIKHVRCPVLAIAGQKDHVATPQASEEIMRLVGSEDKTFHVVPGGHVGTIAGRNAPKRSWQLIADWLAARA